jgi:hypothetical protein
MTDQTPTRWERILAAALQHLAADEAALLDYAAELLRDRDAYKLLASVALNHCHDLAMTVRRQNDTIARQGAIIREYVTPSPTRERRAA